MDQIPPYQPTGQSLTDQTVRSGLAPRCIRYIACVFTLGSIVWGPAGLGQAGFSATPAAVSHGEYLAAGFGFQSAESALITIKTYHKRTGTVLSEDSFDLKVQEDGISMREMQRGRIFAGGIGVDSDEPTRFLLRAYDAVTGHFLWEGQLNFRSRPNESKMRPIATVIPQRTAQQGPRRVSGKAPVQVSMTLRAMHSQTGRIIWEDRFTPDLGTNNRGGLVRFDLMGATEQKESLAYVFDLVVRAFDTKSARLLWQDSFEDHDAIEWTDRGREEAFDPDMLPQGPPRKGGPIGYSVKRKGQNDVRRALSDVPTTVVQAARTRSKANSLSPY